MSTRRTLYSGWIYFKFACLASILMTTLSPITVYSRNPPTLTPAQVIMSTSISLAWNASTSTVAGYRLKWSTNSDLSNPGVVDVGTALTGQIMLPPGNFYYVWVVAHAFVNGTDTESGPSNVLQLDLTWR